MESDLHRRAPFLVIVLFLCVHVIQSDICQSTCICHQEGVGTSVICSSQAMVEVPMYVPENISYFDLTRNNLTALTEDSFKGMSSLLELHLDHNHIRDIAAGTFVELPYLTTLSLSNNDLITLGDHVFTGLTLQNLNLNANTHLIEIGAEAFVNAKVETLSLDRCSIRDVPPSLFAPLHSSLKYIYWSQSVRPLVIPEGLLAGLEIDWLRLRANSITEPGFLDSTHALHIDLSENQMSSFNLSAYKGLVLTESLILASNVIHTIEVGEKETQLHLKDLDISDNKVTSLDPRMFQFVPNITRLNASSNSLTRLQADLLSGFSQLTYLNIKNNPFVCDCTFNWFLGWEHAHSDVANGGDICPNALNLAEQGDCRTPQIINTYDQEEKDGFVLSCESDGLPAPNTTWYINVTTHGNHSDYESILHRSSNLSTISVYVEDIVEGMTCISAVCVAENIIGSSRDTLVSCYDGSTVGIVSSPLKSYNSYLQPLLATMVCLSVLVVVIVLLGKYIRSKGTPWKSWLHSADHALTGERTLISDVDEEREPGDDEREQMSTESV